MAQLVGDFLIERLLEWKITHIFGFHGDGINGLISALNRAKDKMDFMHRRKCLFTEEVIRNPVRQRPSNRK